ncbi:hypothetical protein, partial [Alistipes putredinis]
LINKLNKISSRIISSCTALDIFKRRKKRPDRENTRLAGNSDLLLPKVVNRSPYDGIFTQRTLLIRCSPAKKG